MNLNPGAFVVEHGAGLYSTPLIARHDVRVLVIEEAPGWLAWARWLYAGFGRETTTLEMAKRSLPYLSGASLVFVDGAARERGALLRWALDARVPCVVAHDTERDQQNFYNYGNHQFSRLGYTVVHDGDRPRTTVWQRNA